MVAASSCLQARVVGEAAGRQLALLGAHVLDRLGRVLAQALGLDCRRQARLQALDGVLDCLHADALFLQLLAPGLDHLFGQLGQGNVAQVRQDVLVEGDHVVRHAAGRQFVGQLDLEVVVRPGLESHLGGLAHGQRLEILGQGGKVLVARLDCLSQALGRLGERAVALVQLGAGQVAAVDDLDEVLAGVGRAWLVLVDGLARQLQGGAALRARGRTGLY